MTLPYKKYSHTNAQVFYIVGDIKNIIVHSGNIFINREKEATKYSCSIRNIAKAISILKKDHQMHSETLYKNGKVRGIYLFFNPECTNRIIKNNKEPSIEKINPLKEDKFLTLLSRTRFNENDDMEIKARTMFQAKCGWSNKLEAEFNRHWHRHPKAFIQLLLSFYRTKREHKTTYVINVIRSLWHATDAWFQEHVVKGLEEWYSRIENAVKQLAFNFTAPIKNKVNSIKNNYQEQKQIRSEVKITFNIQNFGIRIKDIPKTRRILCFFKAQGRTSKSNYPLFLYALKHVRIGIDDRLYDVNKNTEFLLTGGYGSGYNIQDDMKKCKYDVIAKARGISKEKLNEQIRKQENEDTQSFSQILSHLLPTNN